MPRDFLKALDAADSVKQLLELFLRVCVSAQIPLKLPNRSKNEQMNNEEVKMNRNELDMNKIRLLSEDEQLLSTYKAGAA